MTLRNFYIGRPQQVAALLLLVLFGECLFAIAHQPLSTDDYRYARCGREMWEAPSAIAGYYTTCGNMSGDGSFAYRLAGFPLSAQRWVLLAADHLRKPEDRLYAQGSLNGSTWEARHEISYVKWLLRLPFVLFAVWLGGGLWWVAKRLFGQEGGALALGLYVLCPAVIRTATHPNNDVLAMWGLYGLLYTSIGVAHALQGPRRKWRPRILLLTVALGLTACAHVLAAVIGWVAGLAFFLYLAERRRALGLPIMIYSALGAVLIIIASYGFRPSGFLYVFTGGAARFMLTTEPVLRFLTDPLNSGILSAVVLSVAVYLLSRRSRYFGNTTPLLMLLALIFLATTQVFSAPWIWALPFLFTFVGGVFADLLEPTPPAILTRRLPHFALWQRRAMLLLTFVIVAVQGLLCWTWLNRLGG